MEEARRTEAMGKILAFIRTKSVFPEQIDYDRRFSKEEQDQLIEDLGQTASMRGLGIVHPSAVFNIEALRVIREENGEPAYIVEPGVVSWDTTNSMLFENPTEEEEETEEAED